MALRRSCKRLAVVCLARVVDRRATGPAERDGLGARERGRQMGGICVARGAGRFSRESSCAVPRSATVRTSRERERGEQTIDGTSGGRPRIAAELAMEWQRRSIAWDQREEHARRRTAG